METAAKSLGQSLPTATVFRKELEIRNKRQDGPMREAISWALSHSLATASQYYQVLTTSDAYTTYSVMQKIIGGAQAASPSPEGEGESGCWVSRQGGSASRERRHALRGRRRPLAKEGKGKTPTRFEEVEGEEMESG